MWNDVKGVTSEALASNGREKALFVQYLGVQYCCLSLRSLRGPARRGFFLLTDSWLSLPDLGPSREAPGRRGAEL